MKIVKEKVCFKEHYGHGFCVIRLYEHDSKYVVVIGWQSFFTNKLCEKDKKLIEGSKEECVKVFNEVDWY